MAPVPADTPQLLLRTSLKALRLPTMLREYDRVARQCAVEDVNLYTLPAARDRTGTAQPRAPRHRTPYRQAKFPVTKSLDSFDFLAIPSLNKAMVLELARGEFLLRRENVLLLGNSGSARRTSRSRSVWPPASMATASASPPRPPWSAS